jgi:hypothetical protein
LTEFECEGDSYNMLNWKDKTELQISLNLHASISSVATCTSVNVNVLLAGNDFVLLKMHLKKHLQNRMDDF